LNIFSKIKKSHAVFFATFFEELELAESSTVTDLDGFEKDDLDYPKEFLEQLQKNGIDISGFSVAEAFEGNDEVKIEKTKKMFSS